MLTGANWEVTKFDEEFAYLWHMIEPFTSKHLYNSNCVKIGNIFDWFRFMVFNAIFNNISVIS
jgi:hypothetical protein